MSLCASTGGCNLAYPLDGYQALPRDSAPPTDDGGGATGAELIQQETAQGSATRALTVKLPAPPAMGDALIVAAASVDTTPVAISGGGATWKQAARSSNHVALAVWIGFVATSGASDVTTSWNAAQSTALVHVSEWRGPKKDGIALPNDGTAGGAITTAALTTSSDTVLVFAAAGAHAATLGPPSEGFVALKTVAASDSQLATAYLLAPSPGLHATSWSYPSTQSWEAIVAPLTR